MVDMKTYKQIQEEVKKKHGFLPKTCWIADVKEKCGYPVRRAWNRKGKRTYPCPKSKFQAIKETL